MYFKLDWFYWMSFEWFVRMKLDSKDLNDLLSVKVLLGLTIS